jgi:hypothetical protein
MRVSTAQPNIQKGPYLQLLFGDVKRYACCVREFFNRHTLFCAGKQAPKRLFESAALDLHPMNRARSGA